MPLQWDTRVIDFETTRRRKRLSQSQPLDYGVLATWIVTGLICSVWARILWLAAKKLWDVL